MFKTLHTHILSPSISQPSSQNSKPYTNKVQFLLRQQIQPWHPSSTLVHEAALAVLRLKPSSFWAFSAALFDESKGYYDANVVGETRNQTYERLAELAERSVGVEKGELVRLLRVSDQPGEGGSLNAGNGVTDDVKMVVKVSFGVSCPGLSGRRVGVLA